MEQSLDLFSSVSLQEANTLPSDSVMGVLVLSLGQEILYANAHARRLIEDLEHTDHDTGSPSTTKLLPSTLAQLCHDLVVQLGPPSCNAFWPSIQIQRQLVGKSFPILARGLGIPELGEQLRGKLMVMLEAVARRPSLPSLTTPHTSLTSREMSVVDGIAAGLTNKQIGAHLNLSEGTVKEYGFFSFPSG